MAELLMMPKHLQQILREVHKNCERCKINFASQNFSLIRLILYDNCSLKLFRNNSHHKKFLELRTMIKSCCDATAMMDVGSHRVPYAVPRLEAEQNHIQKDKILSLPALHLINRLD